MQCGADYNNLVLNIYCQIQTK